MRLKVNEELCQGHGRCYTLYPELFKGDEEGYSTALDIELVGELATQVDEVVEVCPECAISAVDPNVER